MLNVVFASCLLVLVHIVNSHFTDFSAIELIKMSLSDIKHALRKYEFPASAKEALLKIGEQKFPLFEKYFSSLFSSL